MFAWHSRCLNRENIKGNRKKKRMLLFIELSESQQNDSNPENIEVYSHSNIEPMSQHLYYVTRTAHKDKHLTAPWQLHSPFELWWLQALLDLHSA